MIDTKKLNTDRIDNGLRVLSMITSNVHTPPISLGEELGEEIRNQTHYALEKEFGFEWDEEKNMFKGLSSEDYNLVHGKVESYVRGRLLHTVKYYGTPVDVLIPLGHVHVRGAKVA